MLKQYCRPPCPPQVDLDSILGLRSFDLDRILGMDPEFLEVRAVEESRGVLVEKKNTDLFLDTGPGAALPPSLLRGCPPRLLRASCACALLWFVRGGTSRGGVS